MSAKNERIKWVDVGKCICIIFVIFNHITYTPDWLFRIYSPFFLTCFFFLAGMFVKFNVPFQVFFKNKLRALLFPWLVWGLFDLCITQVLKLSEYGNFEIRLFNFFAQRYNGGCTVLWFIACLFLSELILYFLSRVFEKRTILLILVILTIFSVYGNSIKLIYFPWHIEVIFISSLFTFLGNQYHEKITIYEKIFNNRHIFILVSILYAINVILLNKYQVLVGLFEYTIFPAFWIVTVILGNFWALCLFHFIKENRISEFIGQNTLLYLALHLRIKSALEKAIASIFFIQESDFFISLTLVVLIIAILVPFIFVINKYAPELAGKKRKVKVMGGRT